MIFLLLRIVIFIILIAAIYQVFSYFLQPKEKALRCPRCLGKGGWKGVRERETCNRCKGTGKLLMEENN